MDEDQARPDPGISRVALAGPDPKPTYDECMANLYPKFKESLKFLADEHVILDDPLIIDLSPPKPTPSTTQTPVFTATTSTTTTTDPLPSPPQQQSTTDSELAARVLALEQKFTAFKQKSKNLDNTTQNLGSRVFTLELRDLPHKIDEAVRENVKEAVQIALQAPLRDRFIDLPEADMKEMLHQRMDKFFAERDKSHKRRCDDQDPHPPLPDSDPSKKRRHDSGTSGSSQPLAPQSSAWKSIDTRDAPSGSSKFLQHLLKIKSQARNGLNADSRVRVQEVADLEGQAYEVVKAFHPDVVHLQFQMEECHKMLTDQIDWANPEGDQVRIDISRPLPLSSPPALSISKMKTARYHDFGLELLVPEHMWIDDVCTYDISASYGISHWWFNRQKFYIDRHTTKSSRKPVRTYMRILSVVSLKAYSRYGYDYLKEITLRRVDYQEYTITEKDFKNLYPSDLEDLNLLLLQGYLNHVPGSDKRMLSTAVNLWTRNLHDYTIIETPRAVVFLVGNNERKIMRFNEIYKFSVGTLTNILEALDYKVEYKVNWLNPGMNTRFWTAKDVTRSKEFIHAIEQRLKTRRIFWNLECFVGGHV
ncbi:hypothetical protein Tco_0432981 [Tanacetum coccineum]